MAKRLTYSPHALQRLEERGILRQTVEQVVGTKPRRFGRQWVFELATQQPNSRSQTSGCCVLRVVIDRKAWRVITAYYM